MFYPLQKRLSHKRWRAFVKAEQRRRKRRKIAQLEALEEERKLALLMSDPSYRARIEEQERLEEEALKIEEEAGIKRQQEWLERDLVLHLLWLKKKEAKQKALENKIKEEEFLRKEWEESFRKEEEEEARKLEEKEARLREATSGLGTDMSHNPEPPPGYSRIYKEKSVEPCPFFNKTGACRYGPTCSREHKYPSTGRTLLLTNMYSHIGLDGELADDYDADTSLEYSESERYHHFRDFYYDVLPEFKKCGRVIQFKVCCNKSAHLRGNVYVQYAKDEDAEEAVKKFNGRWYAGKQISCIFIPIEKWKAAICGLHWSHKCPKGNLCNFLHVYRNPGNAFYNVDAHQVEDKNQNSSRKSRSDSSSCRENNRSSSRRKRSRSSSRHSGSSSSRKESRERSSRRDKSRKRSRDRECRRRRSRSKPSKEDRTRASSKPRSRSRSRPRGRNKENKKNPSSKS